MESAIGITVDLGLDAIESMMFAHTLNEPCLKALGSLSVLKHHAADDLFTIVLKRVEIIGQKPVGEFFLAEARQVSVLATMAAFSGVKSEFMGGVEANLASFGRDLKRKSGLSWTFADIKTG
jgi:hypothetical protein